MPASEYESRLLHDLRCVTSGPLAFFGRGRVLSLVVMGMLFLCAHFTGDRDRERVGSDGLTPVGSVEAARPGSGVARIVKRHGGIVVDDRAEYLQHVGNRLLAGVSRTSPRPLRFVLLQDRVQARLYACSDGSILMTRAMFDAAGSPEGLAEVLSRRLSQVVLAESGGHSADHERLAEQMMVAAGLAHPAVDVPSSQWAEGRTAADRR